MIIKGKEIELKELANLVVGRIEFILSQRRLRLWKTIWVNYRLLPFRQAIKLPLYVYGKVNILSLSGKVVFNCPIRRGMVLLGIKNRYDLGSSSASIFENSGTIVLNGKTTFYNGFVISVSKKATLNIGRNFLTNNNITFKVTNDVTIGDHVRIASNSKLMTTDSHYIVDVNKYVIGDNKLPITLGHCNWLASDVKIFKGTVTPNNTIVTANTVLNKDYTKSIPENSIIGGAPAKLLKEGKRRIFSESGETENMLNDYFNNSGNNTFKLSDNTDLDKFCTE